MLDPDVTARRFRVTRKDALLPQFLEPLENEQGELVSKTPDQAEIALDFLVEKQMIVVNGDQIAIHPRFEGLLHGSPDEPAKATVSG